MRGQDPKGLFLARKMDISSEKCGSHGTYSWLMLDNVS
jgi:hypothetical protein